jgi:hypothetical protein
MVLLRGIWSWLSSESSRPFIGFDYSRLGVLLGKAIDEKDSSLMEAVRSELGHRFPSNQRSALEQIIAGYAKEESIIVKGDEPIGLQDHTIPSDSLLADQASNKDTAEEYEEADSNTHGLSAAAAAVPLSDHCCDISNGQGSLDLGSLDILEGNETQSVDPEPLAGAVLDFDAPDRSSLIKPPTRTLSTVRFQKQIVFTLAAEDSEAIYCIRSGTSGVVVSMNLNHPLGKVVFSTIDNYLTSCEGRILRDLISALALAEAESIHGRSPVLRRFRSDVGRILAECPQCAN